MHVPPTNFVNSVKPLFLRNGGLFASALWRNPLLSYRHNKFCFVPIVRLQHRRCSTEAPKPSEEDEGMLFIREDVEKLRTQIKLQIELLEQMGQSLDNLPEGVLKAKKDSAPQEIPPAPEPKRRGRRFLSAFAWSIFGYGTARGLDMAILILANSTLFNS